MELERNRLLARRAAGAAKWLLVAVTAAVIACGAVIALGMLLDWRKFNPLLWQGAVLCVLGALAVHALYEIKQLLMHITDQLSRLLTRDGSP